MKNTSQSASPAKAWIITGPTSGIGRRTALELASHGTIVLVGRDPGKLSEVQAEIQAQPGGHAVQVVCDFSDIATVRRAAATGRIADAPDNRTGRQQTDSGRRPGTAAPGAPGVVIRPQMCDAPRTGDVRHVALGN